MTNLITPETAAVVCAATIAAVAWLVRTLFVPVRDAAIRWLDTNGDGRVDPGETAKLHESPFARIDSLELALSWLVTSEDAAEAAEVARQAFDSPREMVEAVISKLRERDENRVNSPAWVAVAALALTLAACGGAPALIVDDPGVSAGVTAPGVTASVECGTRYGGDGPCEGSGFAAVDVDVRAGLTTCLELASPMLRIAGGVLTSEVDGVDLVVEDDDVWLCMPVDVGASVAADSGGAVGVSVCVEGAFGDECAEWGE